jgi:nicotinate phosphoribosyltransferase
MIRSILDQDLYTCTVGQAIVELYPNTPVKYRFTNRNPLGDMDENFHSRLREKFDALADLRLQDDEVDYLGSLAYMNPQYIAWLKNFRFKPWLIHTKIVDGNLEMEFDGLWEELVYYEVPGLALVSETYFETIDKHSFLDDYRLGLKEKGKILKGLRFSDFGTRRRRNFEIQDLVVDVLKDVDGFQGTSNVYLAKKHGIKPIGTMSHQWIMGVSVMEGLRHANRYALRAWNNVYKGRLGIALTDTYGTEAFWADFDPELSRLYDGVRQDSGNPYDFTNRAIQHYKSVGVFPLRKDVVYSDGLTAIKSRELANCFGNEVGQMFGIGTHLTNDVPGSKALNIVIKLRQCHGVEVVKLGDGEGKATGDRDAVRVVKYVFFGTPLDNA